MNETDIEQILKVPYHSQYRDIGNTLNAHRSCGISSIKMALDYYKKDSPNLEELVTKYITDEKAYGSSGWKHDFFVDFLKSFGLNAYRKEQMEIESGIQEIRKSIENKNPVIVSVEQRLFDKKLFHMILVIGTRTDENGNFLGFFYNDPGRLKEVTGAKQYVSKEYFLEYWRKMAIFTNS
ncbi:MAG: hypothetical protein RI996_100 [Candidatus Parcubacteria bacterium]|jgi:uncharacterized protein YvpB